MRIQLLGNLRISFEGRPVTAVNTNRLQSLIAYLILHGEAPHPRDRLAFTLWPASSESQARTNLRQLLHNLKRALPAGSNVLETDHFEVHWRVDSCAIDTLEFQAAIAEAENARRAANRERELQSLLTAAELYEDDLLPALYDDWITPIRETYRRQVSQVFLRLATLSETSGDYAGAIPWAERLVALDSLSEANHQLLIRLHAANQDRASALRAYHQCMRTLRRELGVEPGPATRELFERILKTELPAPRDSNAANASPLPLLQKTRPLVGRGREWQQLVAVWQAAVEAGPRIAIVSGEPGIGKTRLAEELYQSCIRQSYAAARSRCYAGQGQLAYASIADLLRSDAIRAGWTHLTAQQRSELARVVPEIREQFAEPHAPAEQQPLGESWQRLQFYDSLNAAAGKARKPILLFLDDLQWCDPDSFEWLTALLTSPAARGVLLIGTVRAEETGREHPFTRFVAGLRASGMILEIPLEPLDAEETEQLARMESPRILEREHLSEIVQATRGNPLFVVESVRAGLQSTRVHAVIASRLAQLSPASYELAGLASVIGRPFSFELLEKATDWDESSLSRELDELWQRRIVESRGAAEYDFTHDRLREVAYAELSLVRRRYLHRRVARALIEMYAEDLEPWSGQIASHYERAGMAEEAIEGYARAAAFARRRFANSESADLLRRALALCRGFSESNRRLAQELDLLVALGAALVTTEGYSAPEVGTTYAKALELSERLNHRNVFVILSGAWVFHMVCGDLQKAHAFALEFMKLAESNPSPELSLAGNFLMGSCLYHLGQLEASLNHLKSAIEAHRGPSGSVLELFAGPDLGVFCGSYLAHLAWHRGNPEQADRYAAQAIADARRIRNPFSLAIALDYAALLSAFNGDFQNALRLGREAVELCARHGFAYYLAMANVLTGWAAAAGEDAAAGLAQLRIGLEELRRLKAEIRLPFYFALLAETLERAGLSGEAMGSISTGLAFAGKNGEQWAVAELYRIEGNLLKAQGKSDMAEASFIRGLDAARQAGSMALERRISALMAGRTAATSSSERS